MQETKRLKKELKLFDVYALCTGAMFSSGFFLLPGLAAAQTGPSVAIAYLIAGVLMLPAMFSIAELSTAMPRAGGTYYFLDRALGPIVGTVGGLGSYFALTLKSAFALVGMGAYVALFIDAPIEPIAIVLTLVFAALNIFGAKETTGLQRILIVVLISSLAFFIIGGIIEIFSRDVGQVVENQFTPFMPFGVGGLLGTVGFVFVSYAGLTKISSVAEEVKNPGRNIPLGMMLSIATTTFVYVVGVIIMVGVLDPNELRSDLTPVATAAADMFDWLPGELGVLIVVASAVAAFASTGNAGVMAASRFPLAMGRDRLLPKAFSSLGRFQTPAFSIMITTGLMIAVIVLLDEEGIATIASTFQLLIFLFVNLSVIVMRESQIEFYDPIYKSPLYPWMQIFGILASIFLISYMGTNAIVLTVVVITLSIGWYFYYARDQVVRHGAIYHWFEQLGQNRYEGLEHELHEIMKEQGLRDEDSFEEIITRAVVLDMAKPATFEEIAEEASNIFTQRHPMANGHLAESFIESMSNNYTIIGRETALPNLRLKEIDQTDLVIIRCKPGVLVNHDRDDQTEEVMVKAFFFLASPEENPGQHLRILSQIAKQVENTDFARDWLQAADEQELREILLHSERLLTLWLNPKHKTNTLIGKALREIEMPPDSLVALIRRGERVIVPRGNTQLREGDRITIIGEPDDIQELYGRYVGEGDKAVVGSKPLDEDAAQLPEVQSPQ